MEAVALTAKRERYVPMYPRDYPHVTDSVIDAIREDVIAGMSRREVAQKYKISLSTLDERNKVWGLPSRRGAGGGRSKHPESADTENNVLGLDRTEWQQRQADVRDGWSEMEKLRRYRGYLRSDKVPESLADRYRSCGWEPGTEQFQGKGSSGKRGGRYRGQ